MSGDPTPKEDGSVWTSYADLFTNVAVIFLVMFVFALLKSGLNVLENARIRAEHASELKGRLSPEAVASSEEKVKKIEGSIVEMQKVQSLVDQKMQEIQAFSKSMEQSKSLIEDVLKEQRKKDSLLSSAREQLLRKEKDVESLADQSQRLQTRIEKLQQERESLLTRADPEKMQRLEAELAVLSDQRKLREAKLQELGKKMSENLVTIGTLEKQNSELSHRMEAARLAGENLAATQGLLKQEVERLTRAKGGMERELGEIRAKYEAAANAERSLLGRLAQSDGEREALRKKLGALEAGMDGKLKDLEKFKGLYEQALKQTGSLEEKLVSTEDRMKSLAKTLQNMKEKLRSGVADSLKQKFAAQKLQVEVDPATGTITLQMGDSFRFERNSARLSKKAKEILAKIAPIYAEVVFGDPYLSGKIESIEVTGHASPSFKKTYVDPDAENPDAYAHNMSLSAERAAAIANFMMSASVGDYPHKAKMKRALFAIGKSYVSPLRDEHKEPGPDRRLASVGAGCGPYDCGRSQRVEISFRLREDLKAIEKLIHSAGVR
jgi:outer membrane protein OmpA-like peptidoglycan-associated protein